MGPQISEDAKEFLALNSREALAGWLGITDRQLRFLLYKLKDADRYTTFQIRKRAGGTRTIEAPIKQLKRAQRKLLRVMQTVAPVSLMAKGFVAGRSTYDHAYPHRRPRWVALVDLADFFPTIHFGRVRGMFAAVPFNFPMPVAQCLAQLCCNAGSLPQGAPTSPLIANFLCRRMDKRLGKIAAKHRCSVTRYADDICFSTNRADFPREVLFRDINDELIVGEDLSEIIHASKFAVNEKKTRLLDRSKRQLVTGIVVNDGLSLPRTWRRQTRAMIHLFKKCGEERALEIVKGWSRPGIRQSDAKSLEQVIRGRISHAHWIDKRAQRAFVPALYRAYPGQRKLMPVLAQKGAFRLMSEGPSDLLHFEAALRDLQHRGKYKDIHPEFRNFAGDGGDVDLMETLRRLAFTSIRELTIGVFDCDNPSFMTRYGLEVGRELKLGDCVYAVCLSSPPAVTSLEFCIENLYVREQAVRELQGGARLFFGDEFDRETGILFSGGFRRQFSRNRSVIASDRVTRLSDGASVGLSKMKFAEMIYEGSSPFESMDFEGFGPTFDLIAKLVERHS